MPPAERAGQTRETRLRNADTPATTRMILVRPGPGWHGLGGDYTLIEHLGPRTRRVYAALHERISSGQLAPGAKLPPHLELAAEFGVAPMTVRQVLGYLEQQGLVLRRPGRGTFVQAPVRPRVLVVEDGSMPRTLLSDYVEQVGYHTITASGPAEGLAALDSDSAIALVLSDVRLPDAATGSDFIRAVRRRWPELPVAAVTTSPDDLAELHGRPECPILILPKPFRSSQIKEVLHLALTRAGIPRR